MGNPRGVSFVIVLARALSGASHKTIFRKARRVFFVRDGVVLRGCAGKRKQG